MINFSGSPQPDQFYFVFYLETNNDVHPVCGVFETEELAMHNIREFLYAQPSYLKLTMDDFYIRVLPLNTWI